MATPGRQGICVIMAGGRGTRFWPLSRTSLPKQLLPLAGELSLLRATYERVAPLVGPQRVLVITSGDLAPAIADQLPELPPEHIVAEPVGRNTAPCAVLGMGLAARLDPDLPVALLPADHLILEPEVFREQLATAFARAVAARGVVTLGIPPSRPETGFGYLETGPAVAGAPEVLTGVGFVEKPDRARAEAYVAGGRHLWNSGIFVWDAGAFAAAVAAHAPDIAACLEPAIAAHGAGRFDAALEAAYADCPAISIDHAVMEKLAGFEVIPARFTWSDLGSWTAWGDHAPELEGGNRGIADLISLDSRGNVLHVRGPQAGGKLVALIGVEDLIVVETGDALLICRAESDQQVKDVTDRLARDGRRDLL
jgi:mannose-1-phosphate guanylyltransferase